MREHYEKQLELLNQYIIEMGQFIVNAIDGAIQALLEKNVERAKETIAHDERINHKQKEIESLCLQILISQQPVATDLRMVSAAMKMVTDMERIGDHAADISEIILILAETGYPEELEKLRAMARETIHMVKESVLAYVERNVRRAESVIAHDDVVDHYFVEIKDEIIRSINENIQNGEQSADILMIVKYLERIGDHATNIAEWIVFYITGALPEE